MIGHILLRGIWSLQGIVVLEVWLLLLLLVLHVRRLGVLLQWIWLLEVFAAAGYTASVVASPTADQTSEEMVDIAGKPLVGLVQAAGNSGIHQYYRPTCLLFTHC